MLYFRQNGFHGKDGIGAACLEFGFFAWGADRASAEECLEGIILSYFRGRIENNEIQEILDDVSDDFMEPYWALYRRFSITQATSGVPAPYIAVLEELRQKEGSVEALQNKLNDAERAIESLLAENAMLKEQQKIEDKEIVRMQDFFDTKKLRCRWVMNISRFDVNYFDFGCIENILNKEYGNKISFQVEKDLSPVTSVPMVR